MRKVLSLLAEFALHSWSHLTILNKTLYHSGNSNVNTNIARILGVRGKIVTLLDVSDRIVIGLPPRSLDRVKALLQLSDRQMSAALGVSLKTIGRARRTPDRRLSPGISDRLFRLARVFAAAREVLGDEDAARSWLRSAQLGLNNRIPMDLLSTEAGTREVEDLLGRIEYGVLS